MDSKKSRKTRYYGEGPNRSKDEHGTQATASAPIPHPSSSTRPHPYDRTRSEPLIAPVSPSKLRHDARSTRASMPATRRQQPSSDQIILSAHSPILSMPKLNFAVLGTERSGKSTFIRCALDLKKPATSPTSSKKMSLEGELFLISLIEVPMDDIKILAENIHWPELLEEEKMPHIDGVLAICDVTDRNSVRDMPRLLGAPPPSNGNTTRTRAMTTSNFSNEPISVESHNAKFGHTRAASAVTGSTSRVANSEMRAQNFASTGLQREQSIPEDSAATDWVPESPILPDFDAASHTPSESSTNGLDTSNGTESLFTGQTNGLSVMPEVPPRDVASVGTVEEEPPTDAHLKFDDDNPDEVEFVEAAPGMGHGEKRQTYHGNGGIGLSFDELVAKLLSPPMSKSDSKFAAIFLCLYRKFAAPAQLLSEVIRRFESLNDEKEPHLIRTSSQLRHLGILAKWITEYPGDFAHPLTRQQMSGFVAQLATKRVFAVAAKEMAGQIEVASEDDDTDWACSDMSRGRASTLESFSSVVSMRSTVSALLASEDNTEYSDITDPVLSGEQSRNRSVKHSKSPSSASSAGRSGSQSAASFSVLLSSLEAAQSQAAKLTPVTRNTLTKVQWHLFMEIDDDDIARELTRIDWIMYTSIRPRDLIRHVSLSGEQKEKCRSLEHVNRMIDQFNHVAFWVANMILLRDKPKHRAKALEKFMGVAWKLRQLNNYNSLGAIVAGINGTAVHRLVQTRELVSQQAQKDFMRLEILMGTQRSHFAYRLAWENTTTERIPFLPLHRRDLVSAEEGNRTFIGENLDRINWKKFEIMGEVIVGIQRSQGTSYPYIKPNVDVQRMVLEGKFSKDDDELYERSIQLEGPGIGENTRKRFNWWQR